MAIEGRVLERLKVFQGKIGDIIRNKLTYPRTMIGIARQRPLNEKEWERATECIKNCILLIEATCVELIDEFEGF